MRAYAFALEPQIAGESPTYHPGRSLNLRFLGLACRSLPMSEAIVPRRATSPSFCKYLRNERYDNPRLQNGPDTTRI
jgi:hypothetical protein